MLKHKECLTGIPEKELTHHAQDDKDLNLFFEWKKR